MQFTNDIKNFVKKIILKKIRIYFLITSALSKIYGIYFPGGNELCLHQTCNFRKTFFINDNLLINLKVVQLNKSAKIISIYWK